MGIQLLTNVRKTSGQNLILTTIDTVFQSSKMMGEFLMDLQETRPMLENFMSEFTRDIPTSNALFNKYNYGELEAIFLNAIKEAINMDEKVTCERLIESDDLFGDYEWTITCEKKNRGVFRGRDEFSCAILLESTLQSADGMETYSHSYRTYIQCIYIQNRKDE